MQNSSQAEYPLCTMLQDGSVLYYAYNDEIGQTRLRTAIAWHA